ncbi:polysaccharide lyase, putative [Phytophthora infestans T30-4]|uniref:Probable pectate lyase F n=1 Tax=Phytophthora infestans (strain T30-4) TaxID=403677 RepID=D0RMN4_PHYIT|nr:polysaccharide lyase, putative [Phytophthora infestans T30-4]EEY65100.1 polysaccharide lyase, putative [Phytophthora infestans T30-4]|eukprot:XP_002909696.1 polysaccharide lyase, putative [Phytophthora infestans T30-4]
MKTYARSNVKCGGQKESGWQSAVFMVEPGATLKNVIIGKDQMEGVHCEQNGCTIQNVAARPAASSSTTAWARSPSRASTRRTSASSTARAARAAESLAR